MAEDWTAEDMYALGSKHVLDSNHGAGQQRIGARTNG